MFEPGGPELVATTQHLVQGALQQELGDLIAVESVEVTQDEGTLSVTRLVRRAADAAARRRRRSRGACRERTSLLRRAPPARGQGGRASSTGSSTSRSPTPRRRPGAAPAHALRPAAAAGAGPDAEANVVIDGGERIPRRSSGRAGDAAPGRRESPRSSAGARRPGARSCSSAPTRPATSRRYTLRLVAGGGSDEPPAGFDPLLVSVDFSFKVECPTDFDCAPACDCPPEQAEAPSIDYLAKDYDVVPPADARPAQPARAGLDRARRPADAGIALVELLAYVADELSYRQDAVATEAYLATARRRTSLRRHARLVDYVVHEGANARAWVRVFVDGEGVALDARHAAPDARAGHARRRSSRAGPSTAPRSRRGAETFETLEPRPCSTSRTSASTSGRGATPAAACRAARPRRRCVGDHPQLKAGDVLVLAEVAGPRTGRRRGRRSGEARGRPADERRVLERPVGRAASTTRRRTTPVAVTEIAWDEADALPFPLCISVEEQPGLVVGEAWGNIVLADHGRTIAGEPLGAVPPPGAHRRGRGRLRPVRARADRRRSRSASGRRSRTRP